jgi:hypothetical protein
MSSAGSEPKELMIASTDPLDYLELRATRRHRLCRRDPLPALYRRAARLVSNWRAAGLEVLILHDRSLRPARLNDLPHAGAVILFVPSGETVTSIRDMLDTGEPKRAVSRQRVEVRFKWPGHVDAELQARARELAGVRGRGANDESCELGRPRSRAFEGSSSGPLAS